MSRTRAVFRAMVCGMPLMFALPALSFAEGDVGTDLELRAGLWSRDLRLAESSEVAAGSISAGARWTPHAPISAELEVFATGSISGEATRSDLDVRKGFLTVEANRIALRVGRQVDVWGRADRLNPTDMLSPRDYTTLSTDDDDQRRGLGMARLDIETSDSGQLSAYWIPEFRANRLLIEPPATTGDDEQSWEPGQFALRYDVTGGAVDWSLSYYQGLDRTYDLAAAPAGLAVRHNTIRSYGADIATTAAGFGLRAEGAYVATAFDPDTNPLVRRPEVWIVAGADRSFGANTYLNVQTSLRRVTDEAPVPAAFAVARAGVDRLRFQQDETQIGLTANLRHSWDDRRWQAELVALHYLQRSQGLLRAELRHQLSGKLSLIARAQVFRGESGSYFDRISEASSITLELRAVPW
jgi:hypothetical protein